VLSAIETDYRDLAELLNRTGSPLPPSELHGGLCGVICASGREAAAEWLVGLVDDCAGDAQTLTDLARQLELLGQEAWGALSGLALEFEPLLPDDQAAIDQRAHALGLWCHGFLAGLVVGGVDLEAGSDGLSPEFRELVRDFMQISQAGLGAEDGETEENDQAFVELVEFVRVGVQFAFEELLPETDRPRTIH
jgi:uncharacterized protein YgfB (UPF0149 family)